MINSSQGNLFIVTAASGAGKTSLVKAILKNNFSKRQNFTRFLKARLTSTKNGKLEIEVLKGQESFKIKSFVESNVWGLFKDGQSDFKKGEFIECYSPIGSNINIFK